MDVSEHWERVYQAKQSNQVSWFRPHLDVSLDLLIKAGLNTDSRVIDVGAGASTLVDDLLDRGVRHIVALDISSAALEVSRQRVGEREHNVQWIVSDVTKVALAPGSIDLWHDRATLHFLTNPVDAAAYVSVAAGALKEGGYAVIGGFASGGPDKCSQLDVVRRDPDEIAALFGKAFRLVDSRAETHTTPSGSVQAFVNHPIALANVLREEGQVEDPLVIAAALLHDTIEDTETPMTSCAGSLAWRSQRSSPKSRIRSGSRKSRASACRSARQPKPAAVPSS